MPVSPPLPQHRQPLISFLSLWTCLCLPGLTPLLCEAQLQGSEGGAGSPRGSYPTVQGKVVVPRRTRGAVGVHSRRWPPSMVRSGFLRDRRWGLRERQKSGMTPSLWAWEARAVADALLGQQGCQGSSGLSFERVEFETPVRQPCGTTGQAVECRVQERGVGWRSIGGSLKC